MKSINEVNENQQEFKECILLWFECMLQQGLNTL